MVHIYVNGVLAGELVVSELQDRDTLRTELERARRLEALPKIFKYTIQRLKSLQNIEDHVNDVKSRATAFSIGLMDGIDQKTVENPDHRVPPLLPNYDPSYVLGYEYGSTLAGLINALDEV